MQQNQPQLKRALGLPQATVLNMIDMVGIGPFTTLPIILLAFPGKFSLIPWIIGAVVSLADGMIWGELGSAWPQAGGSYVFLQKLYKGKAGRILSFLYVVQTSVHTPLVITSAAIGFVNYVGYLVPLNGVEIKLVMIGLVLAVIGLLYRNVVDVGRLGMLLSVVVVCLLLWTIVTGFIAFDTRLFEANSVLPSKLSDWQSAAFWFFIGNYTSKTIYAYLGYYNVCHLGSEIRNPEKNIPRSILISIVGIAVLYILMQWAVAGSVPQAAITHENIPLVSLLFERVYGKATASIATVLLLVVAASSLFALLLGYTRIIYAAAAEGMHFKVFAHLHPTKHFPDYALLIFGAIAMLFCLWFSSPSAVFRFIVVTRIFIQFIPQAIGVILLRVQKRTHELHFRIPLYPLTPILSLLIWLYVFISSGYAYFSFGLGVMALGLVLYFAFFNRRDQRKDQPV
jgi:fructoselysine transporter